MTRKDNQLSRSSPVSQSNKDLYRKRDMINHKEENRNDHLQDLQSLDPRGIKKGPEVEADVPTGKRIRRRGTIDRNHLKVRDGRDLAPLAGNTDTDLVVYILLQDS
jgi:hypothetical protein